MASFRHFFMLVGDLGGLMNAVVRYVGALDDGVLTVGRVRVLMRE